VGGAPQSGESRDHWRFTAVDARTKPQRFYPPLPNNQKGEHREPMSFRLLPTCPHVKITVVAR
jgi:hypothetical protein